MPTFLDSVESCFGTRDLYEALGIEKMAKEGELRRAYHRLSLKVHPDRVPPDQVQDATEKFQVSFFFSVYQIVVIDKGILPLLEMWYIFCAPSHRL